MIMITRRLTLLVFGCGLTGAGLAQGLPAHDPNPERWEFKVTLDDREIGYHHFERSQSGKLEHMDIEARFKVQVMFFTAYQYAHDNRETWDGDCLMSIESTTNDNGTDYAISGTESGNGFSLMRNQERASFEQDCVQTFAYWNPDILDADVLLNAQTGQQQPVSIVFSGERDIELQGVNIRSDEYVISTPDGDITVWYAQDSRRWLGLETLTDGDRVLRYEPLLVPEAPVAQGQFSGPASTL